jgi:NAD(P)-dependent dehydrogenase (short-subunit alcohol dehydrogenase family)
VAILPLSSVAMPNTDRPTVIVTGASPGVGLHATKSLCDQGWFGVMACRDLAKAARAAQQIPRPPVVSEAHHQGLYAASAGR